METEVVGKPRFDPQAVQLLSKLSEAGLTISWEKEWRSYEIIEQDIAASSALLAIVDTTWTSSTWMASEVTWAAGGYGAMETSNKRISPIPVFLYPAADIPRTRFPFSYNGTIILDRDVDAAIAQIAKEIVGGAEVLK